MDFNEQFVYINLASNMRHPRKFKVYPEEFIHLNEHKSKVPTHCILRHNLSSALKREKEGQQS